MEIRQLEETLLAKDERMKKLQREMDDRCCELARQVRVLQDQVDESSRGSRDEDSKRVRRCVELEGECQLLRIEKEALESKVSMVCQSSVLHFCRTLFDPCVARLPRGRKTLSC